MTETNKGPVIKDFDAVSPERRVARIGGREVDVTSIPARVMLNMARFKDDFDDGRLTSMQQIEQTVDLIAKVTTRSDPEVTAEWLLDHLTLDAMFDFIKFVLEPVTSKAEAYAERQGNGVPAES